MKRSLLGGAALLLAQQAFADPSLSAQLQLLSRTQQSDHFVNQYEVTLTNNGTESLSAITLSPSDPVLFESSQGVNEILIDNLPVGAQYVLQWDMKTAQSVEYYQAGKVLGLDAQATNALGELIGFSVACDELPQP